MSFTLTTSGQAIAKAGSQAAAVTTVVMNAWSDESEATLSGDTRKDWVADIASVKTNFKQMLSDAVSSDIAIKIANNNPDVYSSTAKYQTIIDVNFDKYNRIVRQLKDKENQKPILN